MNSNRSIAHFTLFGWLILHAFITCYTLVARQTSLLEWDILLQLIFTIGLAVTQFFQNWPKAVKRMTWAALVYNLLIANGSFVIGAISAARKRIAGVRVDLSDIVPVDNVIYLTAMTASAICAILLGVFGFVVLSRSGAEKTGGE